MKLTIIFKDEWEKLHYSRRDFLDSEEILAENWRIFPLHSTFQDTKSVIGWCASHKIIYNFVKCSKCKRFMSLKKRSNIKDNYEWKCYKCCKSKSIRTDSIFQNSIWNHDAYLFMGTRISLKYSNSWVAIT